MQVNKITNNLAKLMLIDDMGYKKAEMPTKNRPYCIFDMNKVDVFVKNGEKALPKLTNMLQTAKTEDEIVEGLYIADRMIDGGVKGIGNLYYSAFSNLEFVQYKVFQDLTILVLQMFKHFYQVFTEKH